MALKQNKSLYVDESGELSVRTGDVEPQQTGELLIETLYSGVNPADVKHGTLLGIRNTVMGYDFCGTVLEPSSSKFEKGDLVMGYTPSGLGRPTRYGTHQTYLSCPEDMVRKMPYHIPDTYAGAFTIVAMTAADTLYNLFKFPLPDSPDPKVFSGKGPLLIWGASSRVGVCTIQFARASGCQHIFVTASPGRHEFLSRLGATQCFDYASPTVVADIRAAVEALGRGPIAYGFDAVGTQSKPSSADLLQECITDPSAMLVSSVLRQDKKFSMPFAMAKDDWHIHPIGAPKPVTIPARPADHWRSWGAVQWAVDSYNQRVGQRFELGPVDSFSGKAEDALQWLVKAGSPDAGFQKLVIEHPMT